MTTELFVYATLLGTYLSEDYDYTLNRQLVEDRWNTKNQQNGQKEYELALALLDHAGYELSHKGGYWTKMHGDEVYAEIHIPNKFVYVRPNLSTAYKAISLFHEYAHSLSATPLFDVLSNKDKRLKEEVSVHFTAWAYLRDRNFRHADWFTAAVMLKWAECNKSMVMNVLTECLLDNSIITMYNTIRQNVERVKGITYFEPA